MRYGLRKWHFLNRNRRAKGSQGEERREGGIEEEVKVGQKAGQKSNGQTDRGAPRAIDLLHQNDIMIIGKS